MILFLALLSAVACQQILQPSFFDIAKGKNISATATCGEDYTPRKDDEKNELYCTLAGVQGKFGLGGLSCSYCIPGDHGSSIDGKDSKDHNIRNANDGSNRWWQSPPLSRGLKYREVNVTIDLGQSFHVAYVIVKAANSPRPGVWALERSNDGGKTYSPWHYFAPSSAECKQYFGVDSYLPIVRDNTVLCSTEYSQIPPFQNGEIHISLINGRPGSSNFSYSQTLQEWTSATNVRLRLIDIKTLLTDLLPLSLDDQSVTRRYYYSIKDISIGGRCMCNGFADECKPSSTVGKYECNCQYNTEGPRCERCKEGYVQKKWRPRTKIDRFQCEKCNCHGHSDECEYDDEKEQRKLSLDIHGVYSGGGACKKCQHNTYGINCEKCKPFFYRPAGVKITDENACQACNCNTSYSSGLCADETGQCGCKKSLVGRYCDQCRKGYHMFPNCKPCDCELSGSQDGECIPDQDLGCRCKEGYTGFLCNECRPGYFGYPKCRACQCETRSGAIDNNCNRLDGKCRCKSGYDGRTCDKCKNGYFDFPLCKGCTCGPKTTVDAICDKISGVCQCKINFEGPNCDKCAPGFYRFPLCRPCDCSSGGSLSQNCDINTGQCPCRPNYEDFKCQRCKSGYYGYPQCTSCECNNQGSRSPDCNAENGQCRCALPYVGKRCDRCPPGFYGFPNCKQCNCNPAGTGTQSGSNIGDCSSNNNGQCECKRNVNGLECSECKAGYYNLQESNPDGCSGCGCERSGSINGLLSCSEGGQCKCREFVKGSKCKECEDGYFGLKDSNLFGCAGCHCDNGGSIDTKCFKNDGQCRCRPNVSGRQCDKVDCKFYFPTLHHIQAEMEDGVTPDGDAIRFDYQVHKFPGYTWKGFVFFSDIQPAVIVSIDIPKSSKYLIMFKYVLNQIAPAKEQVSAFKGITDQSRLIGLAEFLSTQRGAGFTSAYATVKESNGKSLYFPLTAGSWKIKLEVTNSPVYVDHVTVIPQEYSDANELKKSVQTPCEVNKQEKFCNLYQYVTLDDFTKVEAENPGNTRQRDPLPSLFNNTAILSKLEYKAMVLLTQETRRLDMYVSVPKPGKYVALIQYYHDSNVTEYVNVYMRSRQDTQTGKAWLYKCRYTFGCRQAILERNFHGVVTFNMITVRKYLLTFVLRGNTNVGLDSVVLIPYDKWHLDYVTPKMYCTTKDGKCTSSEYMIPKNSKKVISNDGKIDAVPSYIIDPNVKVKYLRPGVNSIDVQDVGAGRFYVFIHYYQPNHPSFLAKTTLYSGSGTGTTGDVHLAFCPNLNGCRQKIRGSNGIDVFVFENVKSRFQLDIAAQRDAWIEYLLIVPENSSDLASTALHTPKPLQLSKDFQEQCGLDDYYVKPDATGFCRDSVFSLTTAFNKGALPCNCNSEGSISTSCECTKFGGQCPCKENVIGRTCSRCKIGYYGFPNCKPCNCSNCDDITGRCTCPPGVIGEKCDQCKPGTFGYDPVIGCQPCNCDKQGTGVDDAVCNVITGKCPCKENFASRKCSSCAPGYYNYPICKKCECFQGGVTDKKCNGKTGECSCQEEAVGAQCNDCPAGFFKTKDVKSTQLCTKCWCQGRSTTCKEAQLYRSTIVTATAGWKVSLPNIPSASLNSKSSNIVYWIAPTEFLGDQSASYGGELYYFFEYTTKSGETNILDNIPDVLIKGEKISIKSTKQVYKSPDAVHRFRIRLHQNYWSLEDGSTVSREQMLSVLSNVKSLQVRASHDANAGTSTLWNITMDVALKHGTELIYGIENCTCPSGYAGPSCLQCAIGYTRQKDGNCGKCECFGRSNVCDTETGACYNCTGNTYGDRCQSCKTGFYGSKCKPCECPGSMPGNNFADSCGLDVVSNQLVCQCKKGYAGLKCESCADGYYGQPNVTGGSCKPCSCNDNINTNLTGNCDAITGECFKCIMNTHGPKCEKCKPGFYGDAVTKKNCKNCKCSPCGSTVQTCDETTGQCNCKVNVEGSQCQRCKPNTWNFNACQGCEDCSCSTASESQQCNVKTGQCKCLKTVMGKKCDWCELGYFNYSSKGCQKCQCGGKFCDVKTGSCDCGILGEKCTLCPRGYIIENGKCVECDNCVQNILKRVHRLTKNMTDIKINIIPGPVSNSSLEGIKDDIIRLVNKAKKYEDDLEVYRKAIGLDKYRGLYGDMGFNAVESFRGCEFSSSPGVPTAKPTTTRQSLSSSETSTIPTDDRTTTSKVTTKAAVSSEETTSNGSDLETTKQFTTRISNVNVTTATPIGNRSITYTNAAVTRKTTTLSGTSVKLTTKTSPSFPDEETTTNIVIETTSATPSSTTTTRPEVTTSQTTVETTTKSIEQTTTEIVIGPIRESNMSSEATKATEITTTREDSTANAATSTTSRISSAGDPTTNTNLETTTAELATSGSEFTTTAAVSVSNEVTSTKGITTSRLDISTTTITEGGTTTPATNTLTSSTDKESTTAEDLEMTADLETTTSAVPLSTTTSEASTPNFNSTSGLNSTSIPDVISTRNVSPTSASFDSETTTNTDSHTTPFSESATTTTAELGTTEATVKERTTTLTSNQDTTTDIGDETTTRAVIDPLQAETTTAERLRKRRGAGVPTAKICGASLATVLDDSELKFNAAQEKVNKLEANAYQSSRNATERKERAEELLKSIEKIVTDIIERKISFNNNTGTNVSLIEAENILKELRERNFTTAMVNATEEKGLALNASAVSEEMLKQAKHVEERAVNFNNSLKDFVQAFRNVKALGRIVNANADNATDTVGMAKTIDYEFLVKEATNICKQNNITLKNAGNVLEIAEDIFNVGKQAFDILNNKYGPMASLLEELREYVASLRRDLKMTEKPVNDSVVHAKNLRDLAEQLKKLLQDTKKFAEAAIRAAKVYSEIVDAIYEALAAAKMAKNTSIEADLMANTTKAHALNTKLKSNEVNNKTDKLVKSIKETLTYSLAGVKKRSNELRGLREIIQGRIGIVNDGLLKFNKEKDVGEKANNVSAKAGEAAVGANAGQEFNKKVQEKLEKDKPILEKLRNDIENENKFIKGVESNITAIEKGVLTLNTTIQALHKKHADIEETIKVHYNNGIKLIKFLLSNSLNLVDHVKLTMHINKSSELILPTPEEAYDSSISNEISIIFTTNDSGPLLFIGNSDSSSRQRRATSNDDNGFLSLEVFNHTVVFRVKFNSGPVVELVNLLHISYSAKFKDYYKVVARRTFGYIRLTVSKLDQNALEVNVTTEEVNSTAVSPLLNLGQNIHFLMGSMPLGRQLPSSAFESGRVFNGGLDDFSFNGRAIGLWRWKHAKHIDGLAGRARPAPTGEYCFNGDGFLMGYKRSDKMGASKVLLSFVTLEPDGLLFLGVNAPTTNPDGTSASKSTLFYALQMRDGYLVSSFDFGNGFQEIIHDNNQGKVDDGQTHTFKTKKWANGLLSIYIDLVEKARKATAKDSITYPKESKELEFNRFYVGGVPLDGYVPHENITTKGFIGCIGSLTLMKIRNIKYFDNGNNYKEGFELDGHTASFPSASSYMDVPACSLEPGATFGFAIQTYQKDGVLVHAAGKDAAVDMMLVDSQLKVEVVVSGSTFKLMSDVAGGLSDGKWHAVSLHLEDVSALLYLGIDKEYINSTSILPAPGKVIVTGKMSLGGGANKMSFIGNMRHVHCENREINLITAKRLNGAKFGLSRSVPPIALVPPPVVTSQPTTSSIETTSKASSVKGINTLVSTTSLTPTKAVVQTDMATTERGDSTLEATQTTQQASTVSHTTTEMEITEKFSTSSSTLAKDLTSTRQPTTTIPVVTTDAATLSESTTVAETTTSAGTTTEATTTTIPTTTKAATTMSTTTKGTTIIETTTTSATTTVTTTSSTAPTTSSIAPTPSCKGNIPTPMKDAIGFGFGEGGESYIEFGIKAGSLTQKSQFEFFFYTLEPNGILFTVNMKTQFDYEAVYLNNGKITYVFNAGGGSKPITSSATYNDGKWHKVSTRRSKTAGYLTIDGSILEATSLGTQSNVDRITKVFFGGYPLGEIVPRKIPKSSLIALKGGMKGFKLFDQALSPAATEGITSGYDGLAVTNAISFGEMGGYLVKNTTKVGFRLKLSLKVRSRDKKGYLFYSYGGGDWLLLRINDDGNLFAECNNGGGSFSVEVKPPTSICDGAFHSILLEKDKKTLKLSVDGATNSHTTQKSSSSADTSSLLYFGGVPDKKKPNSYENFSGCISEVKVNDKLVDFSTGAAVQGACMRGCANGK